MIRLGITRSNGDVVARYLTSQVFREMDPDLIEAMKRKHKVERRFRVERRIRLGAPLWGNLRKKDRRRAFAQ